MIGGEHRKERLSERLEHAQNQPKNRGYLPGTEVKSAGYTSNTLVGNWFEERADAAYYDGQAVLPTSNAKLWTTSYRDMVRPVAEAAVTQGHMAPPPQNTFDQTTMMELVDRTQSSYPGHQPHLDPRRAESTGPAIMQTVSQVTYVPPAETEAAARVFVCPVLGGTPGAQADGVLLRLRRQLELSMPQKSAFPGNVMRGVRLALLDHAAPVARRQREGSSGTVRVNAQELQTGLASVGVEVSDPECTALVRFFDKVGDGTMEVDRFVARLRGTVTDRRLQLLRSIYAMLTSIAAADAAQGKRGDGLVRVDRLVELIDVTQLPEVASGAVSAADALAAFAAQWGGTETGLEATMKATGRPISFGRRSSTTSAPDRLVSEADFINYFSDASFEIAGESEFELVTRNLWHMSGGNGKCENTSCRRVRVVHLNGRVTTEEVRNDLAIKGESGSPEVDRLILANLEKQGIKDVKSFSVL